MPVKLLVYLIMFLSITSYTASAKNIQIKYDFLKYKNIKIEVNIYEEVFSTYKNNNKIVKSKPDIKKIIKSVEYNISSDLKNNKTVLTLNEAPHQTWLNNKKQPVYDFWNELFSFNYPITIDNSGRIIKIENTSAVEKNYEEFHDDKFNLELFSSSNIKKSVAAFWNERFYNVTQSKFQLNKEIVDVDKQPWIIYPTNYKEGEAFSAKTQFSKSDFNNQKSILMHHEYVDDSKSDVGLKKLSRKVGKSVLEFNKVERILVLNKHFAADDLFPLYEKMESSIISFASIKNEFSSKEVKFIKKTVAEFKYKYNKR